MEAVFLSTTLDGDLTAGAILAGFRSESDNLDLGLINFACGLSFSIVHFENHTKAEDYLSRVCKKRGPATCVRYKTTDGKELWLIGAWIAT